MSKMTNMFTEFLLTYSPRDHETSAAMRAELQALINEVRTECLSIPVTDGEKRSFWAQAYCAFVVDRPATDKSTGTRSSSAMRGLSLSAREFADISLREWEHRWKKET